jgi:hypothetical protein
MNTIQQKHVQSSHLNEPEVPILFYFILGIILVFGSGVTANGQDINFNSSVPAEIMVCENQESFTIEFTNTFNASLEDVEVSLEMPIGIE